MQQSQSQQERHVSNDRSIEQAMSQKQNLKIKRQENRSSKVESMNEKVSQVQKRDQNSQKIQDQRVVISSLEKIQIQTPMKVNAGKNQQKNTEKLSISINKIQEKKQNQQLKDKVIKQSGSSTKIVNTTSMKSTLKGSQKRQKVNKPFYEETFYITGMKQNYLLLLSDNNQVLQFPIGMFTTQNNALSLRESSDNESNEICDHFHLMKDIKIGQPIKIKLELDIFRQQKDEKIFNSIQRKIHDDYMEKQEPNPDQSKKQIKKKT